MSARNLHRLAGGWEKARRIALAGPCRLPSCDRPASGYIETLSGPRGICAEHTVEAESHGYVVHRGDADGPPEPLRTTESTSSSSCPSDPDTETDDREDVER